MLISFWGHQPCSIKAGCLLLVLGSQWEWRALRTLHRIKTQDQAYSLQWRGTEEVTSFIISEDFKKASLSSSSSSLCLRAQFHSIFMLGVLLTKFLQIGAGMSYPWGMAIVKGCECSSVCMIGVRGGFSAGEFPF